MTLLLLERLSLDFKDEDSERYRQVTAIFIHMSPAFARITAKNLKANT